MFNPENVPSVKSDEELTRYILSRRHIRKSGEDETVKPAAFIPYKFVELSVNRLREASEEETWEVGLGVAVKRKKTLHGRANINVKNVIDQSFENQYLTVDERPPVEGNPNHANIKNWPNEKQDQKEIAQEIARQAIFLKTPE